MTLAFGVIPTNGRECVDQAIAHLLPQVTHIFIVGGGPNRQVREYPDQITLIDDPDPSYNISRWWNLGLEAVAILVGDDIAYDVAVINDDVLVPEGWLPCISSKMRELGAAAGCSGGQQEGQVVFHDQVGPVALHVRMQGFAYVLAGEKGLRADEELAWWYGDDQLGQAAAISGGMVMVPGCHVNHLYPNGQVTGEHQVQIAKDRETFIRKMGYAPW